MQRERERQRQRQRKTEKNRDRQKQIERQRHRRKGHELESNKFGWRVKRESENEYVDYTITQLRVDLPKSNPNNSPLNIFMITCLLTISY